MKKQLFDQYAHLKESAFPESQKRDKSIVRKELREKRKSQDERVAHAKSRSIMEKLIVLPELTNTEWVAAYSSVQEEVKTDHLLSFIINAGKKLVLPKVEGKILRLYHVKNLERDLISGGSYGIREPDPALCEEIPPEKIDLFITPGVGYDCFGGRIGFGGGFYDRLLLHKLEDVLTIGIAYEFQVVHAVPTTTTDVPIDCIVTERSIYQPRFSAFYSKSVSDTENLAKQIIRNGLDKGGIIAFHGDLGTGKTLFIKAMADELGVKEKAASPTFVFCREYHGTIPVYHLDCYRMNTVATYEEEYWAEILESDGLIAIEWAERLGSLLPKQSIHVFGKILKEEEREWTLFTPLQSHLSLHDNG